MTTQKRERDTEPQDDFQEIPDTWEEVEVESTPKSDAELDESVTIEIGKKKKKRSVIKRTKSDEIVNIVIYKLLFLQKMRFYQEKHNRLDNLDHHATIMSLLPLKWIDCVPKRKRIVSFFKYLIEEFEIIDEEIVDLTEEDPSVSMKQKRMNSRDFMLHVVYLLRAIGYIARFVFPIQFETSVCDLPKMSPLFWIDVYCNDTKQWISMDPSGPIEPNLKYKCDWPIFVLSITAGGYIFNETFKYVEIKSGKQIFVKNRFQQVTHWVTDLQQAQSSDIPEIEQEIATEEDMIEQETVENTNEILPTSQEAYKTHPKYFLDKFLTKFQAIFPQDTKPIDKLGKFNIFDRKFLVELHSKDGWLKKGRVVKKDETYFKLVKASATSSLISSELFGEWQTDEFVQPVAENGKVPKNERGQVDLWIPNGMPKGCVHMTEPNLSKTAKKLDIDYAKAMLGFEIHGRRSVPNIQGIIVCEEFEHVLREAWIQEESNRVKKQQNEKSNRALKNWKKMILYLKHKVHSDRQKQADL
jgi:hypothetical protein